jgi:hypothetical protein
MISPFEEELFQENFIASVNNEFSSFEAKALELTNSSATIVVNNQEDIDIAKGRILDITSWINMLLTKHKEFKKPFLFFANTLDAKKKKLEEDLTASKNVINSKITFRETILKKEKADLLIAQKAKKDEEDKLILTDTMRLSRLVSNIRAMLYGGQFINSEGVSHKEGCFSLLEVEKIEQVVVNNLPKPEKFHEKCLETYKTSVRLISDMILARKTAVMTTSGTVISDTEAAIISETTTIIADQERILVAESKKADKAIVNAGKGFRRDIEYEVFDLSRVPKEFLTINESAIIKYKQENRELILDSLKDNKGDGHGFIAGIKFSVKTSSIVR